MAGNAGKGRPKLGKAAKDSQIMMRATDETARELTRIALEMDRSVSWLLNDLAVKFIASRAEAAKQAAFEAELDAAGKPKKK
jgi:hypothetical protein